MKPVSIPETLFRLGEFYPFSSSVKQAIPCWYEGQFLGVVFQRVEYRLLPHLWDVMKARSHIADGEACYWVELTRIEAPPVSGGAGRKAYIFPDQPTIDAAKAELGLLGPALFMFCLETILEKHTKTYGPSRYFFDVFSADLLNLYRFILRKGMSYPYRRYDMQYHPPEEWPDGSFSYYEVTPRSVG